MSWWGTPWGLPAWFAVGPDVTSGNLTDLRGGTLGGHANKVPAQLAYENIALDATLSGAVSNVTAAVASKDTTYTPNVWVVTLRINQSLTYGDVFRLVGVTTCTNDANCAGTLNTDHLLYRSCTMNSNPPTSCEEALSGTSVIFATTYDPAGSRPGTISLSSATITRNPVLSFDASVAYTGSQAGAGSNQRAIVQ